MIESEHSEQLLVIFLKSLDKVSEMSGILKAIQSALNDDVKPELRAIKMELKEKVDLSDHAKHVEAMGALATRVTSIETILEGKEKVKKSWLGFIKSFFQSWREVLLFLIGMHYIFTNFVLKNIPFLLH